MKNRITKNLQYYKFSLYGFFKNLRLFDAFLILFLLDNGMTYVQIGLLYAIREVVLAITEIPSGVIADAFGRRRILISSFMFYILSFVIFFVSQAFVLFVAAMVAFAIGDAFRTGVHKAMIYQYLKKNGWYDQKVAYYGHTRSWSQVGSAISALIAAAVVFYSGNYRTIFAYSVVPYLLDALLIYSYPKYLDGEKVPLDVKSIFSAMKRVTIAFLQSFRRLAFLRVLANSSIYTGYYRAVKDYIQPLIKSFALSIPLLVSLESKQKTAIIVGVIYFLSFLINAFASRNSGRVASRFSVVTKPFNLTMLIGFTLGMISGLTFHLSFYLVSIVCFVSILAVENLRKPMGVAMIADLSNDDSMATVLSATSQAKSVFAAILAPVLGLLADHYGPGMAIAAVAGGLILMAPLYWLKSTTVE